MESPSTWLWVDPKTVVEPSKDQDLGGVHITLMMSPYDLPEAVRGFYSGRRDRFIIQFKYLSDERLKTRSAGEFASLQLGEKTGRIYAIELDVHGADAQAVGLMIKAIDQFAQTRRGAARSDNVMATKKLLDQMGPQIYQSAQAL